MSNKNKKEKKKVSNIKISFSDPVFYVDTEKRTVVCIMESKVLPNRVIPMIQPIAAKGKAKCQEGDVFDLDLGRKIAKTRAENKLIQRTKRFVAAHAQRLGKYLDEIKGFEKDLEYLKDYGENHEKDLIK